MYRISVIRLKSPARPILCLCGTITLLGFLFLNGGCDSSSTRLYVGHCIESTVLYKEGLTLEEAIELKYDIAKRVLSTGPIIRSARSEARVYEACLNKVFTKIRPEDLPDDIRFGYSSEISGPCFDIAGK